MHQQSQNLVLKMQGSMRVAILVSQPRFHHTISDQKQLRVSSIFGASPVKVYIEIGVGRYSSHWKNIANCRMGMGDLEMLIKYRQIPVTTTVWIKKNHFFWLKR